MQLSTLIVINKYLANDDDDNKIPILLYFSYPMQTPILSCQTVRLSQHSSEPCLVTVTLTHLASTSSGISTGPELAPYSKMLLMAPVDTHM